MCFIPGCFRRAAVKSAHVRRYSRAFVGQAFSRHMHTALITALNV